jgi:hypothetical protein
VPPTSHLFHFHLLRAQYQCKIWRNAYVAVASLPEPIRFLSKVEIELTWRYTLVRV